MKMSLAGCCQPVYGDLIIGYITKGAGVKVHRADCPNIANLKERKIDVQWAAKDPERTYISDLLIQAYDRSFLLTDIVTAVSSCKTPMNSINAVVNRETLISTVKLQIQVHDLDQLNLVIANLRKVESVISVERHTH